MFLRTFRRFFSITVNDLKKGQLVTHKCKTWTVSDVNHHTQARSGGHYKVELRDIQSGIKLVERFSPGTTLEGAELMSKNFQFLYCDDTEVHLINPESMDEQVINVNILQGGRKTAQLLTEDMEINVRYKDDIPVIASGPKEASFVITEATAINSIVKSDGSKGTTYKPVKIQNGISLMVPDFITVGERIIVNLIDAKYLGRGK